MKGMDVKKYLPDLNLIRTSEEAFNAFSIEKICDRENYSPFSLYFCGASKFWDFVKEQDRKDVFILFSKKFYEKNEEEISQTLKEGELAGYIENLPLGMSFVSKPFYDEVVKGDNDEVDGRQLGTADIHPTAVIAQHVFIGANVKIGANVRILPGTVVSSHCSIGKGTTLFPNVTLMPRTHVGENCRIHSGSVIGADGFGYNFDKGVHHKVWHMGGVVIGNDVEIGTNVSIDQGTFSPSLIGNGVKIDNLVQVGHNCKLADGVILCGQVGLAGSVKVGAYTVMGGQAGVGPDLEIGSQAQVGGGAGVTGNLGDKEIVAGYPARPIKEWLKGLAYIRKMTLKK